MTADATAEVNELRSASVGEVMGRLSTDASLLLRQEIDLAKTEMTEKATAAGAGVALAVVAAVMLLAALGAGVTAAIAGLAGVVPVWAAGLIVLGGFSLLAVILALLAVLRLRAASPPVPTRALTTAKETPGELIH